MLALEKTHELMFPEYNRAAFMEANPDAAGLMRSYDVFMDGYRLDYYTHRYFEYMDGTLDQLGIHLAAPASPETP